MTHRRLPPFVSAALLLALASPMLGAQTLSWSVEPRGQALAVDTAENVYTVDGQAVPAGDITLTKTAPSGTRLYAVRYDNLDSSRHELPSSVEVDSTGGTYVAGTSRAGSTSAPVNANGVLMRFAPDGTLRWRVLLGADFDGGSTFRVLRDATDTAYVLGLGPTPNGLRMRIHKVTPEGVASLFWQDLFGIGAPSAFKWGLDGSLAIAARATTGQVGGASRVTLDGQTRVVSTLVPALGGVDAAIDALGNLFIASTDPSLNQGRLARVSATFGGSWLINDPLAMSRVEAAPGGGVVVAGAPTAGAAGAALARYGADGSLQWAQRDADGPAFNLLALTPLRVDSSGNAYVAGSLLGQMGLSRVNADGSLGWTLSVPFGSAAGLALAGPSGAVYLVGGQTARIDQGGSPPPTLLPDLVVTMSQQPLSPRIGRNFTQTTTVRNLGQAPAAAVALLQTQTGATVRLLSALSSQGTCTVALPLRCQLGTLAPGASVSITEVLRADTAGTLSSQSSATTPSTESLTSNNSATVSSTVRR